MKAALIAEIEKRGVGRTAVSIFPDDEQPCFTRAKLMPMVRGLFPRREQERVLDLLERSIVFLTPTTIVRILKEERWLHTAWSLANLYLGSIGAELLSLDAPAIVGLSEETVCYIAPEYFAEKSNE